MKIKEIEIEEAPFTEEYLEECSKKVDYVVDLHFNPETNQIQAFIEAIELIEGKGAGKVIYIHNDPIDLEAVIGVKHTQEGS